LLALLVISSGPVTFGPTAVAADDEHTLSQVLNAWRNRQQRVRSFRFQWTEEHFQAKGSLKLPPDPQYQGVEFPPRDTAYRVESGCEMDRDMMRYSFSGESLQVYNAGALEHREYVSSSDGTVSKAFWPMPNKLRAYPKGVIFEEKLCCDASTLDVKPLLWIYRALDSRFAFSEEDLRLLSLQEVVDGRACTIVGYAKGEGKYAVWTDPAREFAPVRFTITSAITGEVTTQLDITYQQDPSHVWTPTGWRITQSEGGHLQRSIVARVTEHAINKDIPKSRFWIVFPPGTVVIDMLNKGERYLVGGDGSKLIPPDARK
jgi:hypothetical protein